MAFKETFKRTIIDGKEVMVCIERVEEPDFIPEPTPEEKIKALEEMVKDLNRIVIDHEAKIFEVEAKLKDDRPPTN